MNMIKTFLIIIEMIFLSEDVEGERSYIKLFFHNFVFYIIFLPIQLLFKI